MAPSTVRSVEVKEARALYVVEDVQSFRFPLSGLQCAIVWVREPDDQRFARFKLEAERAGAGAVKRLPNPPQNQPLALEPASDELPESDVSEVRPVVAEMVGELEPALRVPVSRYVETLLASHGL